MFIYDEWLSKVIDVVSYRVMPKTSFNTLDLNKIPFKNFFMYGQADVGDSEMIKKFQKSNFELIDTNIKLIFDAKKLVADYKYCEGIRFAASYDEFMVRKIAHKEFIYDRFHVDKKINTAAASKVKEEWAGNFFVGKRGDWLVVSEEDGEVNGFLLLLKGVNNSVVIDLIAVDEKHKRKGIAKKMIEFSMNSCLDSRSAMYVGTQIQNLESLSLYTSMGFRVISASYIWHLHADGNL